jgi:hypothetical protein
MISEEVVLKIFDEIMLEVVQQGVIPGSLEQIQKEHW